MAKIPKNKDKTFGFSENKEFDPSSKYSKPYNVHGSTEYGLSVSDPKLNPYSKGEKYSPDKIRQEQIALAIKAKKTKEDAAKINLAEESFRQEGYERVPRKKLLKELADKKNISQLNNIGNPKEVIKKIKELPDSPVTSYSLVKRYGGKLFKVLPAIGAIATGLSVGLSPNPAEAAVAEGFENIIPGGVSELGVSDEQKALDMAYLKKLRQISERKK